MPKKKKDPTTIKPNHKAIQLYHQSLKDYRGVGVRHEGAVETAFQRLLDQIARLHHCQLIPKHKLTGGVSPLFLERRQRSRRVRKQKQGAYAPRSPTIV